MSLGRHRFEFTHRSYDAQSGEILLGYRLDDQALTERFLLPSALSVPPHKTEALEAALDALHWIAGVSYWKAFCPEEWVFGQRSPDTRQAHWLEAIYQHGLAEFAWHNQLDLTESIHCPANDQPLSQDAADLLSLSSKALLPLGGGKDSWVAWHRLHQHLGPQDVMSVQVGSAPLIRAVGESMVQAGRVSQHCVIGRVMDPQLFEWNAQGALNGHVPITAINHAVLAVFALLVDAHWVVFANEASADEPTVVDEAGRAINHQYSKSYAFEQLFSEWVNRYIAGDLKVFSILRQDKELAVVKEFCALPFAHAHFSSCNRNFHINPNQSMDHLWCGQCPKCHFVYLAMAVWMRPQALRTIFGHDLLNEPSQISGFRALLALDGQKPFECVGEAQEARAAVMALSQQPDWSDHAVIQALVPLLANVSVPKIDDLLIPAGPHQIPSALLS